MGMSVLIIRLDREETERRDPNGLCGLDLAIALYREFEAEQPIVLAAPSQRAVGFHGCAFFTMVFRSPVTEGMTVAASGLAPGYSMFRLGYEAIVILSRSRRFQYISITADGAERMNAEAYRGDASYEFERKARKNITDVFLSIGRAGENGVLFASLQSGGREAAASGLGCLLGWKNIKGLMFPGFPRKDDIRSGRAERRVRRRLERSRISRTLRREGGSSFIDAFLRVGSLPIMYYTKRFDPRAFFLDGRAVIDRYGVYPEACQECFFACGRRTKDNAILPTWEESAMLGSNLGFFSIESVRKLSDAVREEGLGASDTGALLAYLGSLPGSDYRLPVLRGKSVDEYARIIHMIGEGRALGEPLSKGLKAFPEAYQMWNHQPILTDLRADKAGAVMAMLGLSSQLPAAWYLPAHPLSHESGAIMAFYETAYRYALVSMGYSPMGTVSEWWGSIPRIVFRIPFLLRIAALSFRAYGLKGRDILKSGIDIIESLTDGWHTIPEHFTMDPESECGDGETVSPQRAAECYEREKAIALRILKSRREKRAIPSSDSSAAVGPSEDLGRDGDPGLQDMIPPASSSSGTCVCPDTNMSPGESSKSDKDILSP